MIEKNSTSLYILCIVLVITPVYFVWSNFPEIMSDCEEKAEEQIMNITILGSLPLISVIIFAVFSWVKK
jgi:hypothetical protein